MTIVGFGENACIPRYEFRRKLEAQCKDAPDDLIAALSTNQSRLLRKSDIQAYREVTPANPRMRYLYSLTIDRGLWRILWLPPSMPYSRPAGPYAGLHAVTKYLVFSAWNVVPDAIASLCSYEAERRMLSALPKRVCHDRLYNELRPLLRYTRSADGRLTGMPVFILLYPSPSLATLVDPLKIAMTYQGDGLIPSDVLVESAAEILEPHLHRLLADAPDNGPEDQRWYWAAPALMDGHQFPRLTSWLIDDAEGWPSIPGDGPSERGERFKEHLELFRQAMDHMIDPPLGRPPTDLIEVLSLMAVAAPGVCALRTLHRLSPSLNWDSSTMLHGAVRISEGFRTLFNLPETIALLRGDESETYWRLGLRKRHISIGLRR